MKGPLEIIEIVSTPCLTVLPTDWSSYQMLYVRTQSGDYDLLLDVDGVPVRERTAPVLRIETFFNKQFRQCVIEGTECLAHVIN